MTRVLIVNADDFGQSPGVNRGIIQAYENGIVTSTSLMVRHAAALDAAEYGRANPALALGLHVDLGEWVCLEGEWAALYEVVSLDDASAVRDEARGQLARFREVVGREPTHLDSHQHVHRKDPVRGVLVDMARELGVPVRHYAPGIRYCGEFYGLTDAGQPIPRGVGKEALIGILRSIGEGVTELVCHPAASDDLESAYRGERLQELDALCHPGVRAAIEKEGIRLRSFSQVTGGSEGADGGWSAQ